MKLKKKTAMIISFTLGTLLFATTALADMATKSGYDQLKDAVKNTFEHMANTFDSGTIELTMVAKLDDNLLESEHSIEKFDRINGVSEDTVVRESIRGTSIYYTYSDAQMDIRRNSGDNKYYVYEYKNRREVGNRFDNPFAEPEAEDVERIVDAIVGNLKDYVMVSENPDGSKELSGSLSEVQIPALINAIVSLQAKQSFGYEQNGLPRLTKDIYVKEVRGHALIDSGNILNSIMGSAILTGKDAQGQVHEISIEVLLNVKDINSTVITKPDLSGADVVTEIVENDKFYGESQRVPQMFVGLFGNNILIEENDRFVKIGERYLEITSITEQTVTGRYYEVYKAQYEDYAKNKREFEFTASLEGGHYARVVAETENGEIIHGSIYFDIYNGKIHLNIDNVPFANLQYDYLFNPIVE